MRNTTSAIKFAIAIALPFEAYSAVHVNVTGTHVASGVMEDNSTRFVLNMTSDGRAYNEFDPRQGQLLSTTLSIDISYGDITNIRFEPSVGPISEFNTSVYFPLFGTDAKVDFLTTWQCPANPANKCTTGGGPTLKSKSLPVTNTVTNGAIAGVIKTELQKLQGTVDGVWRVETKATLNLVYQPFSRDKYLFDLNLNRDSSIEDIDNAIGEIIRLRETDPSTARDNEALRNAEYYLRGQSGMRIIKGERGIDLSSLGAAFNDAANISGPIGAGIYNAKKVLDNILGKSTAGDGELPNSPPGGFKDNWEGWRDGFLNNQFPRNEQPQDNGVLMGPLGLMTPSFDSTRPLQGLNIASNTDITSFYIKTPDNGGVVYFDPLIEDYLIITSQGSRIISFVLTSPSFEESIQLYANGGLYDYTPGSTFDFVEQVGSPVLSFGLSEFPDHSISKEAVFGIEFEQAAETIVMAFNGNIPAIPDAPPWILFSAGLVVIVSINLRKC